MILYVPPDYTPDDPYMVAAGHDGIFISPAIAALYLIQISLLVSSDYYICLTPSH